MLRYNKGLSDEEIKQAKVDLNNEYDNTDYSDPTIKYRDIDYKNPNYQYYNAELSLRDMLNSLIAYDFDRSLFKTPEGRQKILNKCKNDEQFKEYTFDYEYAKPLSNKDIEDIILQQLERASHATISYAGTDFEGCSYNSIQWDTESYHKNHRNRKLKESSYTKGIESGKITIYTDDLDKILSDEIYNSPKTAENALGTLEDIINGIDKLAAMIEYSVLGNAFDITDFKELANILDNTKYAWEEVKNDLDNDLEGVEDF